MFTRQQSMNAPVSNLDIDEEPVDFPEDRVVHLFQIFQVPFHLIQVPVNVHHFVTHVHLH